MRRRRGGGTWFPTQGTDIGEGQDNHAGRSFVLNLPALSVVTATIIAPVTIDSPLEGDEIDPATSQLSEVIANEYLLKRLVGKMFISRVGGDLDANSNDRGPALLVGAGFFIARANDSTSGGGLDTPIGSATAAERNTNYNPLSADCIREPWIWRRNWVLGAAPTQATPGTLTRRLSSSTELVAGAYPASTAFYGSVHDGPHFDSTVQRRVNSDNRLWLAISAGPFPAGSATIGTGLGIAGYCDLRIYGSLVKARNTSAF